VNTSLPQLGAERNLRRLFVPLAAALLCGLLQTSVHAADSAVILMYHRFGETGHPSTNIALEQFAAHLAELEDEKYTVLPVPEILSALKSGKPLPDNTIGITIDDAFRSVYTEAYPRLKKRNLPFTLFIATEPVDKRLPDYMTWDQVRELRDNGVVIGSQTHSHLHMALQGGPASRRDLTESNARFQAELGSVPKLLAYPYGEASLDVMDVARDLGFDFAFGQHSGVLHRTSNSYFLPRFAFNEDYGSVSRFRLVANALPLPVDDLAPRDPLLTENPPAFGFTVAETIDNLGRLSCYHSKHGKVRLERLGQHRVEVRFPGPFDTGRSRLNCTLPGPEDRWRWFGLQFYVK